MLQLSKLFVGRQFLVVATLGFTWLVFGLCMRLSPVLEVEKIVDVIQWHKVVSDTVCNFFLNTTKT